MKKIPSTRQVAAVLAGVAENEMLVFRMTEEGAAVVVKPNGQKLVFSAKQLDNQARLMEKDLDHGTVDILLGTVDKLPGPVDKLAGVATRKPRSKK